MNNRGILLTALLTFGVLALLGGCTSGPAAKECTEPGQVLWEEGSSPVRDAPKWIRGGEPAYKEAWIKKREVPAKYLVYVGVSEDKNNDRGAQFSGVEDMLKRYAFWLEEELDELLPQAAREAKATLPTIDTAVGAYNAVIYLPRENAGYIRALWQARGKSCDTGEAVFRVYALGLFDRETRRAHLLEAAKETFKRAIIKAEVKDSILQEFEKLARRL
jgi:hypothetical protein